MANNEYDDSKSSDILDRYRKGVNRQTTKQKQIDAAVAQGTENSFNPYYSTNINNKVEKTPSPLYDTAASVGAGFFHAGAGLVGLADLAQEAVGESTLGHTVRSLGNYLNGGEFAAPVDIQGGQLGKFVQENVIDLKGIAETIEATRSDEYNNTLAKVQNIANEQGIRAGISAAIDNPSVIVNTVAGSLPSMFAGGVVTKGLNAAARAAGLGAQASKTMSVQAASQAAAKGVTNGRVAAPVVGAFVGEGAVMAGSTRENIRTQTEDGLLTPDQESWGNSVGLIGAGVGYLGGRATRAMGGKDIDDVIAGTATQGATNPVRSVLAGTAGIGTEAIEEGIQSASETFAENSALGRDPDENLNASIALGIVAGGAMGGVSNSGKIAGPIIKGAANYVGDAVKATVGEDTAVAGAKEKVKGPSFEEMSDPNSPKYSPLDAYASIKADLTSEVPEAKKTAEERLKTLEDNMTLERNSLEQTIQHTTTLLDAVTNEDGSIDPDFQEDHDNYSATLKAAQERLEVVKEERLEYDAIRAEHAQAVAQAEAPESAEATVKEQVSTPKKTNEEVIETLTNLHAQLSEADIAELAKVNSEVLDDTTGLVFRMLAQVKIDENKVKSLSDVSREVVEGRKGATAEASMRGTKDYQNIVMNGIKRGDAASVENALDKLQTWTVNYQGKAQVANQVFNTIQSERKSSNRTIDPVQGAQIIPDGNNNWRIVTDASQFISETELRNAGGIRIHQGSKRVVQAVSTEAAHVLDVNNTLSKLAEAANLPTKAQTTQGTNANGQQATSTPDPSEVDLSANEPVDPASWDQDAVSSTMEGVPQSATIPNAFTAKVSGSPVDIQINRNDYGDVVEIIATTASGSKAIPTDAQGTDQEVLAHLAQQYPNVFVPNQEAQATGQSQQTNPETIQPMMGDSTQERIDANRAIADEAGITPLILERVQRGEGLDNVIRDIQAAYPQGDAKGIADLVQDTLTSLAQEVQNSTSNTQQDMFAQQEQSTGTPKVTPISKEQADTVLANMPNGKDYEAKAVEGGYIIAKKAAPTTTPKGKGKGTPPPAAKKTPTSKKETPKATPTKDGEFADGVKYNVPIGLKQRSVEFFKALSPENGEAMYGLAQEFLKLLPNVKVQVFSSLEEARKVVPNWKEDNPAFYRTASRTVLLLPTHTREGNIDMAQVVTHELAHSITMSVRKGKNGLYVSDDVHKLLKEVHEALQNHLDNNRDKLDAYVVGRIEYALSNPAELLAVSIGELDVAQVLASIKLPGKKHKNLLEKMMQVVADLIGINTTDYTALTQVFTAAGMAFKEQYHSDFHAWAKGQNIDPAKVAPKSGKQGIKLNGNTQYTAKDQAKADKATKFIGTGVKGSSTQQYAEDFGELANSGKYTKDDVVFVSVNGNRTNRVKPNFAEIDKAIAAEATLITDNQADRKREFNIGEREVAEYLLSKGYQETKGNGVWQLNTIEEYVPDTNEAQVSDVSPEITEALKVTGELRPKPTRTQVVAEKSKDLKSRDFFTAHFTQNTEGTNPLVQVKDFLSVMGQNIAGVALKFLPAKYKISNAQVAHLQDFVDFAKSFSKTLDKVIVPKDPQYHYQDLAQTLGLDVENVRTAMAAATYSWLLQSSGKPFNDDDAIASLLHLPEGIYIPRNVRTSYKNVGSQQSVVISALGAKAYSLLQLKADGNSDARYQARMEASLGNIMFGALLDQGLVTVRTRRMDQHTAALASIDRVNKTNYLPKFRTSMADNGLSKNTTYNYVAVTRNVETLELPPRIEQMLDRAGESKGILSSIFSNDIGVQFPSFEKPKDFTQQSIARTRAVPSSVQAELVKQSQEDSFSIREGEAKVFEALYNDDLDFLHALGGIDASDAAINELHVSRREDAISAAVNGQRVLRNAMDFINMAKNPDGTFNEFWDTQYLASNSRMQYSSDGFNVQAHQTHRVLAGLTSFETHVPLDNFELVDSKGLPTQLGVVLLSVAENFEDMGKTQFFKDRLPDYEFRTFDKVPARDFLPVVLEYFAQPEMTDAVSAVMDLLDGGKLSDQQKANLQNGVEIGGLGFQSLHALTTMAQLFKAVENGDSVFVTSVGVGSDGINNGVAIANLQAGTASNDMLLQTGIIPKTKNQEIKNYQDTKVQGVPDYYTSFAKQMVVKLNDIIKLNELEIKNDGEDKVQAAWDNKRIEASRGLFKSFGQRAGAKAWTIPFNYNAGFSKLGVALANQFIDDIYDTMTKISQLTKEGKGTPAYEAGMALYDGLQASLNVMTRNKVKLPAPETLNDWDFGMQASGAMDMSAHWSIMNDLMDTGDLYANAAESATLDMATKYIAARDRDVAIQQATFKVYDFVRNKVLAQFLKEAVASNKLPKGTTLDSFDSLTANDIRALEKQLVKYAPFLRTALSMTSENDLEGGVFLGRVEQHISQKEAASSTVKVNGKNQYLKTGIRSTREIDRGVGGAALQVQSGDATVSANTKAKAHAIGVHDADIGSPNNIELVGTTQNETFTDMMIDYDAKGEVFETFLRTVEGLYSFKGEYNIPQAEIDALLKSVYGNPDSRNREDRGLWHWAESSGNPLSDLPSLLTMLGAEAYKADLARLNILRKTYAIQQYGWEGTEHVINDADLARIDQRIKEVKKKLLGLDKAIGSAITGTKPADVTGEVLAKTRMLTPLQKWFGDNLGKDLSYRDVIAQVAKEADPLGKAILKMIMPLIPADTKVTYFNMENVPDAAKSLGKGELYATRGWYNASTGHIYIKSVDSPNSSVTANTLIHELLHGAVAQRLYGALNGSDPVAKAAIDRLNNLRLEIRKLPAFKDNKTLDKMTENIDEFISYGWTEPTLQKLMGQVLVPREGRTASLISGLKQFFGSVLNILGLPGFRGQQISALQAFVLDSTEVIQQLHGIEAVPIPKDFHSNAGTKVSDMEALDVLEALPATNVSTGHKNYLSNTLGQILQGIYRDPAYARDNFTKVQVGAASAEKAGFAQSDRESYVAEAIRIAMDYYVDTHSDTAMITQMRTLFESAKKELSVQDFHTGDWGTASIQEKALANRKYDYMFKTGKGDYLSRFISMALANEDVKRMLDVTMAAPKKKEGTWFEKASDLLSHVINTVDGRLVGASIKSTGAKRALELATSLSDMDIRSRQAAVGVMETMWNLIGKVTDPLNKRGNLAAARLLDNTILKESRFRIFRLIGKTASIVSSEHLKDLPDSIAKLRNSMVPNTKLGEMSEILNEVLTPNALRKVADKFIRQASAIQQVRQNVTDNTKKVILGLFTNNGNDLTKQDHRTITYMALRTDAQSLLKYRSEKAALEILTDTKAMYAAMNDITAAIRKAHPKTAERMINQAEMLGYYMVTGKGGNGLVKNAKGIADGLGTSSFVKDSGSVVLTNQLDQLATLYAIRHTSGSMKSHFAKLLAAEPNGIKGVLRFNQSQVEKAKSDFTGNPYNLIKGYLPDVSNPNREIKQVTDLKEVAKLESMGWVMLGKTERDPVDNGDDTYLMVHKDHGYQRWVSGMIDLQDTGRKGTVSFDNTNPRTLLITRHRLRGVPKFDPANAKGLIAAYDTDGLVMGYSYEMSHSTRDEYLERSNNFADLIGAYEGSMVYKPAKTKQNIEVAKMLHQDFKNNYKRNSNAYVALSPKSNDPELVKMWRMLPHDFKEEATRLYGKGQPIYVNNSILNATVGFRKYSISTIWDKDANDRNKVEQTIHALFTGLLGANAQGMVAKGGHIWGEMVSLAKDAIVIRSLSVLVGNVISNLLLLAVSDVSPAQAVRDVAYATRHARNYQTARDMIVQLEGQKRAGGNRAALDDQIAKYEDMMKRNPLKDFIEAGMLSTIVEDTMIQDADYTYQSGMEAKISKYTDRVPEKLRTAGSWLVVAPSTPLYQTFATVTQYSDFTAKYSMYKALRAKGVSHEEALVSASESFINYDMPSSRGMQYANDIGLFMFTKFFLRFQHVLMKKLEQKSASVIGQHFAVEYFTDLAGIMDPALINRIGNNPFESGAFGLPSALGSIVTVDAVM